MQGSILRAIIRTYGPRLAVCGLLQLAWCVSQLAAPTLLQLLLAAASTEGGKGTVLNVPGTTS